MDTNERQRFREGQQIFILLVHKSAMVDLLTPLRHTDASLTSTGCCSVWQWVQGEIFFSQRKSVISPNLSPWYFMPPSPFSPPLALWSPEKQLLFISEPSEKRSADRPLMWMIWKFGTWEFECKNVIKRNNSLEMYDFDECDLLWHEWNYCCGRIYCCCCI